MAKQERNAGQKPSESSNAAQSFQMTGNRLASEDSGLEAASGRFKPPIGIFRRKTAPVDKHALHMQASKQAQATQSSVAGMMPASISSSSSRPLTKGFTISTKRSRSPGPPTDGDAASKKPRLRDGESPESRTNGYSMMATSKGVTSLTQAPTTQPPHTTSSFAPQPTKSSFGAAAAAAAAAAASSPVDGTLGNRPPVPKFTVKCPPIKTASKSQPQPFVNTFTSTYFSNVRPQDKDVLRPLNNSPRSNRPQTNSKPSSSKEPRINGTATQQHDRALREDGERINGARKPGNREHESREGWMSEVELREEMELRDHLVQGALTGGWSKDNADWPIPRKPPPTSQLVPGEVRKDKGKAVDRSVNASQKQLNNNSTITGVKAAASAAATASASTATLREESTHADLPQSPREGAARQMRKHSKVLTSGNRKDTRRKPRTVDEAKFDVLIYRQEGASKPPPGVHIPPRPRQRGTPAAAPNPATQRPDEPFFGDIDPRVHWSQPHSQAWHEAKQREIEMRGRRKTNFGKAAERMRQRRWEAAAAPRRNDGAAGEAGRLLFKDTLPEKMRENPAWVRILLRMEDSLDSETRPPASSAAPRAHGGGGGGGAGGRRGRPA